MAPDNFAVFSNELRLAREELSATALPRLGPLIDVVADDFDVDLYYEEDELSGLVDCYLSRRVPSQSRIILDQSIDRRIARAEAALPGDPTIAAFAHFRRQTRVLAEILSRAAQMPIVDLRRDLSQRSPALDPNGRSRESDTDGSE